MYRKASVFLKNWLNSSNRKPLVIRGARQVGKTWLVRYFAKQEKKVLIELNFEKDLQLKSLFENNDPKQILMNLEAFSNQTINPKEVLLFLDEIQAAPELLSKLRWFAEEMPELTLIATGSLLEFVLAEHTFSMPVGRINYLYLEPLSFEEFLIALGFEKLYDFISQFELSVSIPEMIHQQLLAVFKEYLLIGGMPAAVDSWRMQKNLGQVNQIHMDLISTYRDDFAKYRGKIAIEQLDQTMMAIPNMLSEKFIYSRVNQDVPSQSIKQALQLLVSARLCHQVSSCHANGVPLAAQIREKYFKVILIDVGLVSAMLGLKLHQMTHLTDLNLVNRGGLSEQVVGQILRTLGPFYSEPNLYYWLREEKGSAAEIDYVIQYENKIVPIEVKSGSVGSLKSLHLFMNQKQLNLAVRLNADQPSLTDIQTRLYDGCPVNYQLVSIPFYLTGQLFRLLKFSKEGKK